MIPEGIKNNDLDTKSNLESEILKEWEKDKLTKRLKGTEKENMVTLDFVYNLLGCFSKEIEINKSEGRVIERMKSMCEESLEPKLYEQFENIITVLKKNRNIVE